MNEMLVPAFAADPLGWMVVSVGVVATAVTIVMAVFWIVRPGERDPLHPKNVVLREDR